MSDDVWRGSRRSDDDDDDFGEVRFADDHPTDVVPLGDDSGALSFGDRDAGSLPHWTDPPTGEMPKLFAEDRDATDDLDVWSSFGAAPAAGSGSPAFGTAMPAWQDDEPGDYSSDVSGAVPRRGLFDDDGYLDPDDPDAVLAEPPRRREPTRISIGTGPDETGARPTAGGRPRTPTPTGRGPKGRGPRPDAAPAGKGVGGRDMPMAVAMGLLIAAAFLGALLWKPIAVLGFVVLVTGLAAIEYFDKVTEKGYRPATWVGIATCVAAPLAAYWMGDGALPLVFAFSFIAAAVTYIGADNLQIAPMPNMAITTLGVIWIGLMGSYAALLADISNSPFTANVGTDTLFIVAAGVVANDVGALFVGSAAGRTPLRPWISPNKSVEGLIGGGVLTLVVVWVVSLQSDTWNQLPEALLLGLAIAVLAPLGDLTESMFKRNLDVKDFGTLVRGHGGILDRFDGFLFVLPMAYYLLLVLAPHTSV